MDDGRWTMDSRPSSIVHRPSLRHLAVAPATAGAVRLNLLGDDTDAAIYFEDGLLHRVAQSENEHQVERGHLPQLALAEQPQPDHNYDIDHQRPEHDLRSMRGRDEHSGEIDVGHRQKSVKRKA